MRGTQKKQNRWPPVKGKTSGSNEEEYRMASQDITTFSLKPGDKVRIETNEFESLGRNLVSITVRGTRDGGPLRFESPDYIPALCTFYCETADQARVFVPSFRSKAEQVEDAHTDALIDNVHHEAHSFGGGVQ